jgi:hypothetical protein
VNYPVLRCVLLEMSGPVPLALPAFESHDNARCLRAISFPNRVRSNGNRLDGLPLLRSHGCAKTDMTPETIQHARVAYNRLRYIAASTRGAEHPYRVGIAYTFGFTMESYATG